MDIDSKTNGETNGDADVLSEIRLTAFHFTVNIRAWNKVCDDLEVDVQVALAELPDTSQRGHYSPILEARISAR